MHGDKRSRYQSIEIERLRQDIRELEAENKALNKELELKDRMIGKLESDLNNLVEEHERQSFEQSEATAKLYEARIIYDNAAKEANDIQKKYKKLYAELEAELKKLRNREVV